MEEIKYRIGQFEGPLDLLLNLVEKNKMKIEDIEISVICAQYMDTLRAMQEMNMDISADFIVMAAQLMLIKSAMLLPKLPEEEDPRTDLAQALREYKRAKEAAGKLNDMYGIYAGRMEKDTDEIPPDRSYVADHDVRLLSAALMKILATVRYTKEDARAKITPLLSTKPVSVEGRVFFILRRMIYAGGKLDMMELFWDAETRGQALATFMALLEMFRDGRLRIAEPLIPYDVKGCYEIEDHILISLNREKIRRKAEETEHGNNES